MRACLIFSLLMCVGNMTSRVHAQGQPSEPSVIGVTAARIKDSAKEPGNWLTYSGQYNGQRFSRLDQLDTQNVRNLQLKWVRQFSITEMFETSPLVVDGVMFITVPANIVCALDAKSGLKYWQQEYQMEPKLAFCCGKVNRGMAILGDTLYKGTLDAKILAIDAKSGNIRWQVQVEQPEKGYSITAAPLIVKDMVITGVAGGEYGIRGFIAAYDADTGRERWKTYSIPGPGESGNDTWGDTDAWRVGGSATWMTGTYDPELDLIYWGVGNPGPDWNGDVRPGDNLYSDCVLALDANTGKIKWHYQFTPHDVWDWDACQIPVLVDREFRGEQRKLMLFGNRNGFFYVLDRESGEFLLAKAFAKQTWAEGFDKKGRPKIIPEKIPTEQGVMVFPEATGAANWWSPSYSPQTRLFYQMSFDGGAKFYKGEAIYREGTPYLGGMPDRSAFFVEAPDPNVMSAVRAIDPNTGERVWQYQVQAMSSSGLLTTKSNLLFGGTAKGVFFALDATSGKELWKLDLGARVHAAPVTYLLDGKQYVTIAAGSALFTFAL